MSDLQLLPVFDVDRAWLQISDGMERACNRGGGDLTAPFLFQECRSGRAMLFAIIEDQIIRAALIGRVENWGNTRVFHILAACGKGMADWLHMITEHETWPEVLGCEKAVFEGRKGWERMVPKARVVRQLYEVDMTP